MAFNPHLIKLFIAYFNCLKEDLNEIWIESIALILLIASEIRMKIEISICPGSSDSEGGGSRAAECYQKKSKRSRGNSVSSTTSSVDVRRSGGQGSLQHAMAVIEDREEEMSHLFDQLHDIQVDLSQMTDQVHFLSLSY